jgi:fluoride exporter
LRSPKRIERRNITALEHVILISIGAAFGANARYWISLWALQHMGTRFPYGTLFVNVTGSLILGFLIAFAAQRTLPVPWRLFLGIGFCGSYTTFSSYAIESVSLFDGAIPWLAWINILSNNLLCLLAVLVGIWLARSLP